MIKPEYTKRELERLHEFLKERIDQLSFKAIDKIEIEDSVVYVSLNFSVNYGVETFVSAIYMSPKEEYDTIRFDLDRAYRVTVTVGDPIYKYEEDCIYIPCSMPNTDCVDFNFSKHKIRNIFQIDSYIESDKPVDYLAIPFKFATVKNGRVIFEKI